MSKIKSTKASRDLFSQLTCEELAKAIRLIGKYSRYCRDQQYESFNEYLEKGGDEGNKYRDFNTGIQVLRDCEYGWKCYGYGRKARKMMMKSENSVIIVYSELPRILEACLKHIYSIEPLHKEFQRIIQGNCQYIGIMEIEQYEHCLRKLLGNTYSFLNDNTLYNAEKKRGKFAAGMLRSIRESGAIIKMRDTCPKRGQYLSN